MFSHFKEENWDQTFLIFCIGKILFKSKNVNGITILKTRLLEELAWPPQVSHLSTSQLSIDFLSSRHLLSY